MYNAISNRPARKRKEKEWKTGRNKRKNKLTFTIGHYQLIENQLNKQLTALSINRI
jgi:hypothetical protein